MAISIDLNSLASRVVRSATSGDGTRRFSLSGLTTSEDGGVLGFIWNGFTRFGSFLISRLIRNIFQGISFSISAIFGIVVSSIQYIWNFNWNASDKQLDKEIQQGFVQLAGSLGGTLGNALGYAVCGAVPGMIVATFNESLAIHILEEVGEEAADEIASNLANLIKQTGNQAVKMFMAWMFKNTRSFFRDAASGIAGKLVSSGAITQDAIDKAKAKKDEPWSFAIAFNNMVESIPNEALQNFVEEFFDEFSDSCLESGYIIARSVESYYAENRLATINLLGGTETIEIYPNRAIYNPGNP